jgi:hypothetical protein
MSFSDDIKKFQRKTNLSMDVIVRKVTIDITNSLVRMSPVDTGRFRGNWMIGVGSPDVSTIEAVDKDGSTTVARITNAAGSLQAGGVVYITNSLPYARRLEYGWSQQAPSPPGIVRLTVQRYTEYLENAVRSLK